MVGAGSDAGEAVQHNAVGTEKEHKGQAVGQPARQNQGDAGEVSRDLSQKKILASAAELISSKRAIAGDYQIIDVRSPGEFAQGSMPGAVNVPLFEDDERSVVGTIYRRGGRNQAIDKGYDIVTSKLEALLSGFAPHKAQPLAVFCARGGMRSRSVVNLLRQSGYQASQVEGGYKIYRQRVMETLEHFQPRLIVVHGFTGTGKTRILQHLKPSLTIDLEGLAAHRSSLFGGIDRIPATQRGFESGLAHVVETLGDEPYFIEGESRKIGPVFIPKPLALAMKDAVLVRVECSVETRITRIIEDYPVEDPVVLGRVENILRTLRQKLGSDLVEKMCTLLHQGELRELVRILLVDYYDKRYGRQMRDYDYDLTISSEDIEEAARLLTEFRNQLVAQ